MARQELTVKQTPKYRPGGPMIFFYVPQRKLLAFSHYDEGHSALAPLAGLKDREEAPRGYFEKPGDGVYVLYHSALDAGGIQKLCRVLANHGYRDEKLVLMRGGLHEIAVVRSATKRGFSRKWERALAESEREFGRLKEKVGL